MLPVFMCCVRVNLYQANKFGKRFLKDKRVKIKVKIRRMIKIQTRVVLVNPMRVSAASKVSAYSKFLTSDAKMESSLRLCSFSKAWVNLIDLKVRLVIFPKVVPMTHPKTRIKNAETRLTVVKE